MAPTKTKLRVKKKDGGGKSSRRLLASASPDSKCPICLDGFNNVASLDRCLHQFCFRCIHEWSKNKAECPLCKQPFHSIFHSVNGQDDFKEFVLRPPENLAPPAGNPPERLLRPRVLRERRSHRLQPPAPSPPDDDIMFGGFSAALTESQDVRRMVRRLTARRSGRGEGRSLGRLRDQDVVAFRRALYRTGVRVRNGGRPRDVSAAFLRQNPACLRRLLPWLQRELTVLYGSHGSLVNIVQHVVMARITSYNMEDSAIRDELRPFLLARTDHFLHELVSFARSTLSMEAYDQQAVYDCPAPSYEEGSSSNSSVIAISEDDDNDSERHATENPSVLQDPPPTNGLPSESGWDDETPGPSYSTLLPSSSQSQDEAPEPSILTDPPLKPPSLSDGPDDDEEECLIVGYVKPMAERTPELVQLSSDSSEEEQEAPPTDTKATVTKSEPSEPQTHVNPRSPAPSAGPAPSRSPSPLDHRSRLDTRGAIESSAREKSRAGSPDPSWSDWGASEPSPASSVPERLSHSSWDDDRGRRRRRKSPESIAVSCRRKRRRRSISISSSSAERSRPDKPGGKRKYKTRHLERAARRQRGERSAGKRNRSPSVEIVFERKANDSQRKKRRKRKQRSPTVITIDSDSDRTIDCLHRVIDQTPTGSDAERENARFVEAPALAPIGSLDLDDCVVDVVNHSGSDANVLPTGDHTASFPDLTTPPTADSRLLESILQDLEDFLPGVEKEEEEEEESSLTQTPNQQIKQCSI